MPGESEEQLSGRGIPDLSNAILGPGCEVSSIPAKDQGADLAIGAVLQCQKSIACFRVPDLDRAGIVAAGDTRSVWTVGEAPYPRCVAGERKQKLIPMRVPNSNCPRLAACIVRNSHILTIRAGDHHANKGRRQCP